MRQEIKYTTIEYVFEQVGLTSDEQYIQGTPNGIEYLKKTRGFWCFNSIDVGTYRHEKKRDSTLEEIAAYHAYEGERIMVELAARDEVYRPPIKTEPWYETELAGKEIILEVIEK